MRLIEEEEREQRVVSCPVCEEIIVALCKVINQTRV